MSKVTTPICKKATLSLHTLPVELVYRILDNLEPETIFWSCHNVCTRLNAITDTYHRYQVIVGVIMKTYFYHVSRPLFFPAKYIILLIFLFLISNDLISYDTILLSKKKVSY